MITIGLPAFKSKFLKEAIESVLNQTYENYELIIVNDASPEDIKEIVNSFDDPRIKYYENNKNLGKESIVKNWNKCLEYAQGEYFVLFSDDDYYEPNFLEELYYLTLKYPGVDVFHCRVKQVDDKGSVISYTSTAPQWEDAIDFLYHRICLHRINYISDFLFRTKILNDINGFYDLPLGWGSDIATCCIAAKENGLVYSSKPLFNYRYSQISLTNSDKYLKKVEGALIFQKWVDEFLKTVKTKNKSLAEISIIIQGAMNNYTARTIINALVKSSSGNFKGLIYIYKNWCSIRRRIPQKKIILLKSILLYIKRVYEDVNQSS